MSVSYQAVGWNQFKKKYDWILCAAIGLFLATFVGVGLAFHPKITLEILLIRAFGVAGILLLHFILIIGPMARLDTRWLPLEPLQLSVLVESESWLLVAPDGSGYILKLDDNGTLRVSRSTINAVSVAASVSGRGGAVRVRHLWCVHDCGLVVSPNQVRAQIEGNLVWGIGMVLSERFTMRDGIAASDNFDRYAIARNADVPDMTIELIDSESGAVLVRAVDRRAADSRDMMFESNSVTNWQEVRRLTQFWALLLRQRLDGLAEALTFAEDAI